MRATNPTTTRAYTARLNPGTEAAKRLWDFHVSYSAGLRRASDHLVSLVALLANPAKAATPLERLAVAAAWLHPARLVDAKTSADDVVPEGELTDRFRVHLHAAGVTKGEAERWIDKVAVWFDAPLADGAVWMDRRARALRGEIPVAGWGDAAAAVAEPEKGSDAQLAQVAGGWVSTSIGTGPKRDWAEIARVSGSLRKAIESRAAVGTPIVADELASEVLGTGSTAGDLALALQTRGDAGPPGVLRRLVAADGAGSPLDERTLDTLTRLVAKQADRAAARVATEAELAGIVSSGGMSPCEWLWGEVAAATGWEYDRVRYVEILTQAFTVARSYRAKQLDRLTEMDDLHTRAAAARVAVPEHVATALDGYCEERNRQFGMDRAYRVGKRAARGYARVVEAWRAMGDDVTADERAGVLSRFARDVGDPVLYRFLSHHPEIWEVDVVAEAKEAHSPLDLYLTWEELHREASRRKAPKLTLPDAVDAPRFPWWGSSKPKMVMTWDGQLALSLPDGVVEVPWRSRRIRRQLRPRFESPDAETITRNDRRSRLAAGVGDSTPVHLDDRLDTASLQLRVDRSTLEAGAGAGSRWAISVVVKLAPPTRPVDDRVHGHRVLGAHFGQRRDASWSVWEMVGDEELAAEARTALHRLPEADDEWWRPEGGRTGWFRSRKEEDEGARWARLVGTGVIDLTGPGSWARSRARRRTGARLLEMGITAETTWLEVLVGAGKVRRRDLFEVAVRLVQRGVRAQQSLARVIRALEPGRDVDEAAVLESWKEAATSWPLRSGLDGAVVDVEAGRISDVLRGELRTEWEERCAKLGRSISLLSDVVFDGARADGVSMGRIRELSQFVSLSAAIGKLAIDNPPADPETSSKAMERRLRARREWAKVLAGKVVDAALENRCSDVVLEDLSKLRPSSSRPVSSNRKLQLWAIQDAVRMVGELCALHGLRFKLVSPSWNSRVDSMSGEPVMRWRELPSTEAARVLSSRWWREQALWASRRPKDGDTELKRARRCAVTRTENLLHALGEGHGRGVSIMVPDDWGNRVAPVGAELVVRDDGGWTVKGSWDCDLNAAVNVGRMGCVRRKLREGAAAAD